MKIKTSATVMQLTVRGHRRFRARPRMKQLTETEAERRVKNIGTLGLATHLSRHMHAIDSEDQALCALDLRVRHP